MSCASSILPLSPSPAIARTSARARGITSRRWISAPRRRTTTAYSPWSSLLIYRARIRSSSPSPQWVRLPPVSKVCSPTRSSFRRGRSTSTRTVFPTTATDRAWLAISHVRGESSFAATTTVRSHRTARSWAPAPGGRIQPVCGARVPPSAGSRPGGARGVRRTPMETASATAAIRGTIRAPRPSRLRRPRVHRQRLRPPRLRRPRVRRRRLRRPRARRQRLRPPRLRRPRVRRRRLRRPRPARRLAVGPLRIGILPRARRRPVAGRRLAVAHPHPHRHPNPHRHPHRHRRRGTLRPCVLRTTRRERRRPPLRRGHLAHRAGTIAIGRRVDDDARSMVPSLI